MKQEKGTPFDFERFKNQAIADMKSGKYLIGKDGILTPLMKEFTLSLTKDYGQSILDNFVQIYGFK